MVRLGIMDIGTVNGAGIRFRSQLAHWSITR